MARYSTRLPRDADSPRRARSWLARKLALVTGSAVTGSAATGSPESSGGSLSPQLALRNDDVISCVNELVISALAECASAVTIRMSVQADTLHVEVLDDGPPSPGEPAQSTKEREDALRLQIVNALADRWGAAVTDSGHESWVEFDLRNE